MTTCFWFDTQAEDAARFYVDVFTKGGKQATLGHISRYPDADPKRGGQVLTVQFSLDGQSFMALNGGSKQFMFTPATSFVISCETQAQIDAFWDLLSEGGQSGQCGWIDHDRFGVSWQVVPSTIGDLMGSSDRQASARAMQAMMGMHKLDIAALQAAFDGK